jgi:hypothetical protein
LRFRHAPAAALLVVAALLSPLAVQNLRADANNPDVIPTFIDAVNRGDIGAAMQLTSPNLSLTLPSGLMVPVDPSTPIPASFLPITIVSLTPEGTGSQTVDGVFTFGSDPRQQRVQIKGDGGVIVSIALLGP